MSEAAPSNVSREAEDVAASSALLPGDIIAFEAFGRKLVLYRTEAGAAQAAARFCPHLGANLARLGKVNGERLVCSSHKWTYDREGHCVAAPGEDQLPTAALTSYPTNERDGRIIVMPNSEE